MTSKRFIQTSRKARPATVREMSPAERQLVRRSHALNMLQKEKRSSQAKIRHLNGQLKAVDKKLQDYVKYAHNLKGALARLKQDYTTLQKTQQAPSAVQPLLNKLKAAETQLSRCHRDLHVVHRRFQDCNDYVNAQKQRQQFAPYRAMYSLTRWQEFVQKHAGNGKNMTQLAAAYHALNSA